MSQAVAVEKASPAIWTLSGVGLALIALTAAGPWLHQRFGGYGFWVLVVVSAAAAAWAAMVAAELGQRHALMVVLATAAALRLVLLFSDPLLSSDIYRYVWDGRVQAAGINPYRHVPAAPELAALRDDAIYPNINRADYAPTIYPPVAQMIYLAVTRFGETLPVMKLGLLTFEALGIWCLIQILQMLGQPAARVAAYAWHPLPVWEIAGNGHADAAMLGLMLLALWVHLTGKVTLAGALATFAALVKPIALLALPVFWRPWTIKLPAVVLGLAALCYLPYLSAGWGVLGFLPGYISEEGFSASRGFRYLGLLERVAGPMPNAGLVYVGLAGLILAALALRISFRTDRSPEASVRALGLLVMAFLVLLTPHYPWYYLAIAPFLVFGWWTTPWLLTAGGFVLYDVIPGDALPSFEVRDGLFRLAGLATLAYDYLRNRKTRPATALGDRRS
jgi:alpha-1,6-mannosyltransferase